MKKGVFVCSLFEICSRKERLMFIGCETKEIDRAELSAQEVEAIPAGS